jgi:hypothetical protein
MALNSYTVTQTFVNSLSDDIEIEIEIDHMRRAKTENPQGTL